MEYKKSRITSIALSMCLLSSFGFAQNKTTLDDLSAFKNPGKNWSMVGDVTADLSQNDVLKSSKGSGILLGVSNEKNHGTDLFTNTQFGDVILELDYLLAKGGNSGIYLQGNYEIQLEDFWGMKNPTASNNGGIYSQWDESKPEGEKGYGGFAPRQNVSRAPGLWQHIKIGFQAPKFDAAGKKIKNALMSFVELNGVLIHENIELAGPTRGNMGKEALVGPLRLQGDHGSVAFRNISIMPFTEGAPRAQRGDADPIYIEANSNTNLRSFVPLQNNVLAPHGISVGGPEQVSYSYDLDKGMLMKAWHGDFLETTPMWDGRGNGTSRPQGSVTYFTKVLIPGVAMLKNDNDSWPTDTVGSGYKPKGYVMDSQDRPEFRYNTYGSNVKDAIKAMPDGHGLTREISTSNNSKDLYLLLANAADIQEVEKGLYLLNDKSYYIRINDADGKAKIRESNGVKQLIIPIGNKLNYSILF